MTAPRSRALLAGATAVFTLGAGVAVAQAAPAVRGTTTTTLTPVVVSVSGTAATTGGGSDVSTSVEIPIGVKQFGARFGADFWKVYLHQGDQLTVDYGSTDGNSVGLCILPPTVTSSAGLKDTQCVGQATTNTKQEVRLAIVDAEGYWALAFGNALCAPHNYTTSCTTFPVAYSVYVSVQRYTQIVNGTPTIAMHGQRIAFAGTVLGTSVGYVAMTLIRNGKSAALAVVPISATGGFAKTLTMPTTPGIYKYRISYYGDAAHLSTQSTFLIRVV